jgi:hypothetical protein
MQCWPNAAPLGEGACDADNRTLGQSHVVPNTKALVSCRPLICAELPEVTLAAA